MFRKVVDYMGVGERMVESFTTPSNTLCVKHRDLQSDALYHSLKGQGLLWMNPLFSLLDKVVTKPESDNGIVFVPLLDKNRMVGNGASYLYKYSFFPPGTRLFETEGGLSGQIK